VDTRGAYSFRLCLPERFTLYFQNAFKPFDPRASFFAYKNDQGKQTASRLVEKRKNAFTHS